MSLERLVDGKRLVVCVGPGGVGKTTLAAAIALDAARRGRRVAVITIDPARRLADALGLAGLDDSLQRVLLDGSAEEQGGALYAAMLDTRQSYDDLMRRIGSDEASTERILENRVYRAFSRTLARSHAYVAMERLYDLDRTGDCDLVVLDTPPLRSALDILDAPERLARFLDDGVVRWFLRPERGRLSRLLPSGGRAAGRLLGLLASQRLVRELGGFFGVLLHLEPGFRERAISTGRMLRAASTAFLLVASPDTTTLADAAYLRDGLRERGVTIDAVLFNRAYVAEPENLLVPVVAEGASPDRLDAAGIGVADPERGLAVELLSAVARLRAEGARGNLDGERAFSSFCASLPASCLRAELPELERDVHDLRGLADLADLANARFAHRP